MKRFFLLTVLFTTLPQSVHAAEERKSLYLDFDIESDFKLDLVSLKEYWDHTQTNPESHGLNLEKIIEVYRLGTTDMLPSLIMEYVNTYYNLVALDREEESMSAFDEQYLRKTRVPELEKILLENFGITPEHLAEIVKEDPIVEFLCIPSLTDCLDPSSPCGLNLATVNLRADLLRNKLKKCKTSDPTTYVCMLQKTRRKGIKDSNAVGKRIKRKILDSKSDQTCFKSIQNTKKEIRECKEWGLNKEQIKNIL